MFSNRIAGSAKFLQMSVESQLLYFHLVVRADDDGVVETYPIMKMLGTAPDAYKLLIARGYVTPINEDQVVIIEDWLEHNVIRADRKVDSIYKNLLPETAKVIEAKPRSDVEDNSRRVGGPSTDGVSQVRLGKVREVKDTQEPEEFKTFYKAYPRKKDRPEALKAWKKQEPPLDDILEAISAQKATEAWKKNNGQFIPYPASWLNAREWEDEVESDPSAMPLLWPKD